MFHDNMTSIRIEENITYYVVFLVQHQLFSMSYFNECSQLEKMSKIVYLYVKPLFLYYFLLIAMMTKTKFVNSQQFLIIILFLCEVITLHKINMISLFLFILFSFLLFPQDHSKITEPSTRD